ncbi:MAG TPA: tol-pal system-associated acyl-CoA thioesterase, partial [Alphaproteobacteria bacterium]|nr:tol-pal system-associated acyl-CoA thioesterase [Alphaproteobacteria bacterium]
MTHEWKLRVYFEDTDAGGVVYYANYLKFIERARTEMLREFGVPHADMMKDAGAQFVVRRCAIDYVKPARLEDELTVRTALLECGAASLTLKQDVVRNGMDLAKAEVV